MKISTIASISNFIQGPLISKLRVDAKNFRIILERDLEYRIYYHITTAINNRNFLIMGNKTISGIRTSAKTRGTNSDSGRFVMPDIMIRDYDKPNDIRILMELKSDKAATLSVYLNRKNDKEAFDADFANLRKYWINHKLSKQLKHEFFIYIYRDLFHEDDLEEIIAKKLRKGKKSRYKQLIPIVINRYQKDKEKFYAQSTRDKIDDEFKRLDDIQVGRNNSKKISRTKPIKKKPKKKKPLTTEQRSRNAKNYWRTKKKLQNRMTEETRKKYGLPPKGKKSKR